MSRAAMLEGDTVPGLPRMQPSLALQDVFTNLWKSPTKRHSPTFKGCNVHLLLPAPFTIAAGKFLLHICVFQTDVSGIKCTREAALYK